MVFMLTLCVCVCGVYVCSVCMRVFSMCVMCGCVCMCVMCVCVRESEMQAACYMMTSTLLFPSAVLQQGRLPGVAGRRSCGGHREDRLSHLHAPPLRQHRHRVGRSAAQSLGVTAP